jgi:hypothetical protein
VNTSWGSRSGGRSVIFVALPCSIPIPIRDCGTITTSKLFWERGELVGESGGFVIKESRQVEDAAAEEFVGNFMPGFESEECGREVPLDRQARLLELNNGIKEVELIFDSLPTVANTIILHSCVIGVILVRGTGERGPFAVAVNAFSFILHRSEVGKLDGRGLQFK